jgi:hypothetical protein
MALPPASRFVGSAAQVAGEVERWIMPEENRTEGVGPLRGK